MLRRPGAAPEGRAHVALRGGRQRGDRRGDPGRERVPRRDARRSTSPSACASGRTRRPPRSRSPRATRSTSRRRCRGSRRRRSTRCTAPPSPADRHAPHDRRHRHRHDRLPVRADAGPGELARAAARAGLLRRRDRARVRGRAGRHAQPARDRDAADRLPGGLRDRHRRARAGQDRRGLDVVGDLRADEALRRGRRGREGPPAPALRRGLRARDGRRRARQRSPTCGDDAFLSARQENLESIHQHDVIAERFGLLGELRHELATGEPSDHHVSMREWLDGAGWGESTPRSR